MKDSTRIVLIVICLIFIILLIGFMIWGIGRGDFTDMRSFKIVKEETYKVDDIEELYLKLKSSDVIFYENSENKIRIVEKANKKIKENKLFSSSISHGVLEIEEQSSNFCIGFCFFRDTTYEIYLPITYDKKINVKTASGDIEFFIENESLSDLKLITVSGDIKIKRPINANNAYLKATSGDIETTHLITNEMKIETVSGDVESSKIEGQIEISTVSGDIEIDDFNILGDSKIKSTSGDIDIHFNQNASCKLSADSVSGDIRFPNAESIVGDGKYSLSLKTVSGDIKVKKIR